MAHRKTFILLYLIAVGLLLQPGFSQAGRIAVLPLEDLSQGGNGLNLAITRKVWESMAARGFTMVKHEEVIDFMVKNRVRWLGHLGSQYIRRLHDDFDVDYLLLGSVNQRRDKKPFALGLTLQLIRTGDAQIIWAKSSQVCGADEISLLGLSDPQDMEEMEDLLVTKALLTIPEDLHNSRPLDVRDSIETFFMEPEILKPGDMVHCRIKLGASPASLFNTSVSILVDERIIQAHYYEGENSYLASWPASSTNQRYPVSITISRPGAGEQKVLVGSYLVDGQVPEVALHLKGQELNGIVVLQKNVAIMPVMKKSEPISRWLMTVLDDNGVEVLADDGQDGLPERFAWWGQARNGGLVKDGFYTIGLTIWDRAGNSASAKEAIRVIRQEPKMEVVINKHENSLALSLAYEGEIPLAYWRLEIKNQDGDIISESSGTENTGSLMVSLATVADQNMSYRLYAQDMLGNHLRRDVEGISLEDEKENVDDGDFFAETEGKKMALREIWAEDF